MDMSSLLQAPTLSQASLALLPASHIPTPRRLSMLLRRLIGRNAALARRLFLHHDVSVEQMLQRRPSIRVRRILSSKDFRVARHGLRPIADCGIEHLRSRLAATASPLGNPFLPRASASRLSLSQDVRQLSAVAPARSWSTAILGRQRLSIPRPLTIMSSSAVAASPRKTQALD